MAYHQGRIHPQVLAASPKTDPPSDSWWLDPKFQRGERTSSQRQAQARMAHERVSTPSQDRVVHTHYGRL